MASENALAPEKPSGKQLSKVAGPLLLWGIAVGAVISGDYYGWNAGLGLTGYWGYLVAIGLMGLLYAGLSASISELGTAIPHAGGAYAYTRTALGRVWGFLAGAMVQMQFVFAPVAVALTTGAYVQILFPQVPVLLTAAILYIASTGLHLMGAGSSMWVDFIFTAVATVGLVVFAVVGIPHISIENLNVHSDGAVFPQGIGGLWGALPLAAWFFFAIEATPMAAEETKNPAKDLPKALFWAFITLALVGVSTLTVAAGVGGKDLANSAAPLADTLMSIVGDQAWIIPSISIFAIASLIASFHAIVLAYSRQTFALSRAGYLPAGLSTLNKHHVPTWGLIVPGAVGLVFCVLGDTVLPDAIPVLINLSVFAAAISYVLMTLSTIVLRKTRPDLKRPVKVPGGIVIPAVSMVLAVILIPAALWGFPLAFVIGVGVVALYLVYYSVAAKKRVSRYTLEEELALVESAEEELE
ncbi:MAG: amino acid permease [Propionibacteriaceae bacterium]|jgi:ethanolamine permease|nr:amino acid permease [Propionibacteriaceae bacterium]